MKELTTEEWIGVGIALVLTVVLFGGLLNLSQLFGINQTEIEPIPDQQITDDSMNNTEDLQVEILQEGSGPEAQVGDVVVVHYRGKLENGTEFDNSYDRGQSFPVQLGANQVIPGWEQGLIGAQAGETRRLTIAPELGYGNRAIGPIPANSTLIFEIEVLEVRQNANQ